MTVRELRNKLAELPGEAVIQPSHNEIILFVFDDELGVVAEIEI